MTGVIVAADIGGTFTDVTVLSARGLEVRKVPSVPADYAGAVVNAVQLLAEGSRPVALLHGTTVATNAVLSGQGLGRAVLVTTDGFRDVLEIGRCRRPNLYSIAWTKPAPLVPRDRVLTIRERVNSSGVAEIRPSDDDLADLIDKIHACRPQAIAVALVNAYRNPAHENLVASRLRAAFPATPVTCGTEITSLAGEYERTSTAVVNAVLVPVMRTYIERLAARLFGAGDEDSLMLMQSNGGLIPASTAAALPAALLESGPAAGVLAAAQLAQRLGEDRLIAFDMGGTTAKACLIDNGRPKESPDYEVGGEINNSEILSRGGGYAVQLPCYELSEVGAGGGSVAWLDAAGTLRIGPQSAGADPGPACYGRGGDRPTVTDANVVLGFLPGGSLGRGDIDIDRGLAVAVIKQHIANPLGMSAEDAALAVRQVANASMVRALRSVSVERGRDARDYTLIAFGGAGPAHAVDTASALGSRRVLIPPAAGVFSSVGLLMAQLRRDATATLAARIDAEGISQIRTGVAGLEAELERSMARATGSDQEAVFEHLAELAYEGETGRVWLDLDRDVAGRVDAESLTAAFRSKHASFFGYAGTDELIEIRGLRVTARLDGPASGDGPLPTTSPGPRPTPGSRRIYFGTEYGWMDVPVLTDRSQLTAPSAGPLAIDEEDCTTIVPPESIASTGADGTITIQVTSGVGTMSSSDGIGAANLEVVRHQLEAITDELALTIFRTGRSLTTQALDFSAALCTADGELAARGVGSLLHLGSVEPAIAAVRQRFPGQLIEGDVVCLNDPYEGGTHLPDVMLIAPVFAEDELVGYTVSLAHQSDIGGSVPGGHAAGCTDLFQEGTIYPPVRLVRAGVLDDDLWRIMLRNTRTPDDVAGDLMCQLAAARRAGEQLSSLARHMGPQALRQAMSSLISSTESLSRTHLAQLRDGVYSARDYVDASAGRPEIELAVTLTVDSGHLIADFSECSGELRDGLNCNWGVIAAAVFYAVRTILPDHIPNNGGFGRCISIRTREGTVVCPRDPAPVAARALVGSRLVDLMFKALAEIPGIEVWAAGEGGIYLTTFSGKQDGKQFVLIDPLWGGSGGRPFADAVEAVTPAWANGRNNPIELVERGFPVRIIGYGFAEGTGGRGKFRGSNGLFREWELLGESATVFCRTDRRTHRPWGLDGGQPGAPSTCMVLRAGAKQWETLEQVCTLELRKGDRLRIVAAGGGGYGPAAERPAALSERDRREGRVL